MRAFWLFFFFVYSTLCNAQTSLLEKFSKWFNEAGGKFSPLVTLIEYRNTCESERTISASSRRSGSSERSNVRVVTRSRLPRDSVIVATPLDLLLTPLDETVCPSCDLHERLALRLLYEQSEGVKSPWFQYVIYLLGIDEKRIGWRNGKRTSSSSKNLLNKKGKNRREFDSTLSSSVAASEDEDAMYFEASTGNSALDFTGPELDLLAGTFAGSSVVSYRKRLNKFLFRVKASPQGTQFSDAALKWAMSIVLSKSFTVLPSSTSIIDQDPLLSTLYSIPFLAPGCDILNHSPVAQVGWTLNAIDSSGTANVYISSWKARHINGIVTNSENENENQPFSVKRISDKMFAIVALEPYARGGVEVFNSYHNKASNAHLFAHYGFTSSESNNHDGIVLNLPLQRSQVLTDSRFGKLFPSLLFSSISSFQKDLEIHVRSLKDVTVDESTAIERLFKQESKENDKHSSTVFEAINTSTARGILKRQGSGPFPHALLNVARLAAISSQDVENWLSMYTNTFEGKGVNTTVSKIKLVPESYSGEVSSAENAIKDKLQKAAHKNLLRSLSSDRVDILIPLPTDQLVLEVSATGTFHKSIGSETTNEKFPLTMTDFLGDNLNLNTSALIDLYAFRLLYSTVSGLLRQYPGGADIETDTQVLGGLFNELQSILELCGDKSVKKQNKKIISSQAAAASVDSDFLVSTNKTAFTAETINRINMIKRRINIYKIRIDEMRILKDNLQLLKANMDEISLLLVQQGVVPISNGNIINETKAEKGYFSMDHNIQKGELVSLFWEENFEETTFNETAKVSEKVNSTSDSNPDEKIGHLRGNDVSRKENDEDTIRFDHEHEHSI